MDTTPTTLPVKPVVNRNLQRMIARHAEEKANRRAAGETAPTVYVEIVVTVAEPKHVDALVEFMNEHATGWIGPVAERRIAMQKSRTQL